MKKLILLPLLILNLCGCTKSKEPTTLAEASLYINNPENKCAISEKQEKYCDEALNIINNNYYDMVNYKVQNEILKDPKINKLLLQVYKQKIDCYPSPEPAICEAIDIRAQQIESQAARSAGLDPNILTNVPNLDINASDLQPIFADMEKTKETKQILKSF